MAAVDRLAALLPPKTAKLLEDGRDKLTEIRLRAGRPIHLVGTTSEVLTEENLDVPALQHILAALMDYSVYARQSDLDRGFFTLDDGSRVGVCGRMYESGGRVCMGEIGSVCVRLARPFPGCADGLMGLIRDGDALRSTLLVSPPGMGKTTLLRDVARQLSVAGFCVGIADERHELAACHGGVPTLDVGPRTDVMDGCERGDAIRRMLRGMAPRVIVADEIGGEDDAKALADAVRCGVTVIASAHGDSLEALRRRGCMVPVMDGGIMESAALLGPGPGMIRSLWSRETVEEGTAWRRA